MVMPYIADRLSAAVKDYIDGSIEGLISKGSVRALAASNITLSGTQTIDGVSLVAADRVLLTNQTDASENGAWVVSASSWSRPSNFDTGDGAAASFWFVNEGTTYGDTRWWCTDDAGSDVIDTDNLTIEQFSGASEITAGDGLTKTGNTLAVATDVERTTNKDTASGYVGLDGSSNASVGGNLTVTGDVTGDEYDDAVSQGLKTHDYTQADNTTATTVFSFATASFGGCDFTYYIERGTDHARVGTLRVVHINGNVTVDDTGVDEATGGSLGITWSATVNGANIDVKLAVDAADTDDIKLNGMARLLELPA